MGKPARRARRGLREELRDTAREGQLQLGMGAVCKQASGAATGPALALDGCAGGNAGKGHGRGGWRGRERPVAEDEGPIKAGEQAAVTQAPCQKKT